MINIERQFYAKLQRCFLHERIYRIIIVWTIDLPLEGISTHNIGDVNYIVSTFKWIRQRTYRKQISNPLHLVIISLTCALNKVICGTWSFKKVIQAYQQLETRFMHQFLLMRSNWIFPLPMNPWIKYCEIAFIFPKSFIERLISNSMIGRPYIDHHLLNATKLFFQKNYYKNQL